jgi:hypothetical protein
MSEVRLNEMELRERVYKLGTNRKGHRRVIVGQNDVEAILWDPPAQSVAIVTDKGAIFVPWLDVKWAVKQEAKPVPVPQAPEVAPKRGPGRPRKVKLDG